MTHIQTKTIIDLFLSPRARVRSTAICACLAVMIEQRQATIDDVADRLKVAKSTVRIVLNILVKEGFLTVEKKSRGHYGRANNIYRIKP